MTKPKIGRPKKPPEDVRKKFMILLSQKEKELLAKGANLDGLELSTWIRMTALGIARERTARR